MKLNFIGGINKTSYGYHSSYAIKYLTKLGVDVRVIPLGRVDPDPKFNIPTGLFHHNAPCLRLWHQHSLDSYCGSPKIAYSAFELEDLSELEIHNIRNADKFLVPCHWAKDVCSKYGIDANVVPLGYDEEVFKLSEIKPSDTTVFGCIGKFEIRKGHDVLIKAFNAAFSKDDSVALAMMPHNPFLNAEQVRVWERMYLGSKLGEKIQIIPRVETHEEVANVISQIDVGVFPSRAEGFHLEPLEFLGSGKHVILTDCTGHKEYLDDSCHKITMNDENLEVAYDGIFFFGKSRWRKLGQDQLDQLIEHMRSLHKNRSNLQTNLAGHKRALNFTWEKSINVLQKEISSI